MDNRVNTEFDVDAIWRRGLAPDPAITVSEWAERHRMLPQTTAEPGRWRNARTPYLREVMDCLSPASPYERVVIMSAAQIGKSEVLLNFTGAAIHLWPGLTLVVQPTTEAARRFVRTRVDPMLEATPELASRIVQPGPRKSGNSAFFKAFPGGAVAFVGANSGVGLRSTPARFVLMDEVDAFPASAGDEGDPVQLAAARTATFRGKRKILLTSTPTIKGVSRIERAYEEGDQRRLFLPCPSCGEFFVPVFAHLHWQDGKPETAHLACPSCGGVIEERDKPKLLAGAQWRATADGDGITASFHISGLFSPFVTWAEIARDFLASKSDPSRLQVWTNVALGESLEDRETAPLSPDALQSRARETDVPWNEVLPDGVAILTCGVDVQDDRLELEVIGWGRAEESWSIDYQIIHGDTSRPGPWDALDQLIARRFRHLRAVPDLPISAVCVDSGGHRTDAVMRYSAARFNRRVWAVKGRGGQGVRPWPVRPPKPRRSGVAPVFVLGVDGLKSTLMSRLRIEDPSGPGVIHVPSDRDYWWFQGLVAERAIRKWTRGMARIEWVKDGGVRNEPLDCRVYGSAALHGLYASGLSLAEVAAKIDAAPRRPISNADEQETPLATPVRVIRSRWLSN
ncbi:MAG: phage terminase large subunit family protein [Aestuariivirga sp.]|nr:phage terminase large subunit family protein [Aestuariivirga sp.]